MSFPILDNFDLKAKKPLDTRSVVQNLNDVHNKYNGMAVFSIDDDEVFIYKDSLSDFEPLTSKVDQNIKKYPLFTSTLKNIHVLSLKPPNYNTIISTHAYDYLYPQSFCIDEVSNELIILFVSVTGVDPNIVTHECWYMFYDLTTFAFKSCFYAGSGLPEGVGIWRTQNKRYLIGKTTANGYIGLFNITSFPANLSSVSPESSFNAGLYSQFSVNGDYVYVESNDAPMGGINQRNRFLKYNLNTLGLVGEVTFNIMDSSNFNDYENYFPKRQGIAFGNNFIAGGYGAIFRYESSGDVYNKSMDNGVKLFNANGEHFYSHLVNGKDMIDLLVANGIPATRIENEGCCIDSNNNIYTLDVIQNANNTTDSGIIITKHFALSDLPNYKTVDYRTIKTDFINYSDFTDIILYRQGTANSGSNIINPITGATFTTIEQIILFMIAVQCSHVSFYTTDRGTITDYNGTTLPVSSKCDIYNLNNSTFFLELTSATFHTKYLINNSPRVQSIIPYNNLNISTSSSTPLVNNSITINTVNDTTLRFYYKNNSGTVKTYDMVFS